MTEALGLNTAILYFSRTPIEEARQKSFTSGKEFYKNFRIAGLLRSHTQRQIEKSGLPYFVFDERNQKGVTFGEKLTEAFKAVFSRGYQHVIAVGNDTPRLESHHMIKAANQMEKAAADIVLGPATDGGTWLMGFSHNNFREEFLKNTAWNSNNLLTSIVKHFENSCDISMLEVFDDVDNCEDLEKLLTNTRFHDLLHRLKRNILALFQLFRVEFYPFRESVIDLYFYYFFLLRAPPTASDALSLT
ncbi:MAG: DUF2064 domain-containing protein [Bacteroidetes bacterium]|jgi:glycosyltransferase A (GT-A) superfamily protein (DUF2064 family)|nr:DUF2064 domain-containing protein [Bacteroidota bacterium]